MSLPLKELPDKALDALITSERTRVVAPLTEWRTLSMSLRQEGLLQDGARPEPAREYAVPRERNSWLRTTGRWTMRLAASALLVGAGIIAGRGMTIGQDLVNQIHVAMSDSTGESGSSVSVSNKSFQSSSEAKKSMLRAQAEYERAAAFLAATDSSPQIAGDPETYRDRLTGLDDLTNASLTALKDSPQDAMLNSFYLSASAAREGTLQRLAHALPPDERLVRF